MLTPSTFHTKGKNVKQIHHSHVVVVLYFVFRVFQSSVGYARVVSVYNYSYARRHAFGGGIGDADQCFRARSRQCVGTDG